jgi:outer membrane protein TolC
MQKFRRQQSKISKALLGLSLVLAWPLAARAQQSENQSQNQSQSEEPRRGLKEFQDLAEKQGAELNEQRGKLEYAQAREGFALSKGLPQGTLDAVSGVLPDAHGNALTGATDWNSWGPFFGVKAELIQPIYTFGALTAGREAARIGSQAEEHLLEKDRFALRSSIAEYYYGYQLAFELSDLVTDIRKTLEDALDRGEKIQQRKGRGAPSATDLDKLRVALGEIKAREAEALKGMDLARAAMAWKIGIYGKAVPRWDHGNLLLEKFTLKSLGDYQALAQKNRPELKALHEDAAAKNALMRVEQGLLLPTLYVGGRVEYSVAPGRESQSSPFAYDPLNSTTAGVFLGLRWNLGLFEESAKLKMARAEYHEAQARLEHLGTAILTDVERAYLELKQNQVAVEAREDAGQAAKRVYQDATVAYGLKTGSAKDLLEALGNYGVAQKSYDEAIYNFNLGIVKLRQATGTEDLN